jgi:hypothetical protein
MPHHDVSKQRVRKNVGQIKQGNVLGSTTTAPTVSILRGC